MKYKELLEEHKKLLTNIKSNLPNLKNLLIEISDHWQYEDFVYRFYHQSFKTYPNQKLTLKIVDALKNLYDKPLNEWFLKIIDEGTTQKFSLAESNNNWLKENRPQLEAFFHAKYMLEMIVKYGEQFNEAPKEMLPSGWDSVLYLYNLR